eukprot:TRINITY_DN20960_c0_g1_i2.p2 TRINITY_DN20960_c0_g1~~TRINITY_DN20960_c0_g1_i2.p2  ORF type:complete len:167 (+),score=43.32 TRINITY_DN20960_c0_g1_i2:69-503(+)
MGEDGLLDRFWCSIFSPAGISLHAQRQCERIITVTLWVSGFAGVVWGFVTQSTSQMMLVFFAGALICGCAVLPPWAFWPQDEVDWVPRKQMDRWLKTELAKELRERPEDDAAAAAAGGKPRTQQSRPKGKNKPAGGAAGDKRRR